MCAMSDWNIGPEEYRDDELNNISRMVDEVDTSESDAVEVLPEGFDTYSYRDLANLPQPEWLVEGWLQEQSFGVLVGPSGVGKSFAAISLMLSIATNSSWYGHEVKTGSVLYCAGEGHRGLFKRINAWSVHNKQMIDDDKLRIVPRAPSLFEPKEFVKLQSTALRMNNCNLIVIDTLGRAFTGYDENSTKDMGLFVDAVDRLRVTTGATVLIVHHTNGQGEVERGNKALRGAADTMLFAQPNDAYPGSFTFLSTKQKDSRDPSPMAFNLADVPDTGSAVPVRTSTSISGLQGSARYGVSKPSQPVNQWAPGF